MAVGKLDGSRGRRRATLFAPNAFVRIDRLGKVSIVSPMAEMGQGVYTALPMLVAEELDADMSNVTVEHSPPNDKLYGNAFLGGVADNGQFVFDPCLLLAPAPGRRGGARHAGRGCCGEA